jgi:hypothetical protein
MQERQRNIVKVKERPARPEALQPGLSITMQLSKPAFLCPSRNREQPFNMLFLAVLNKTSF